MLRHRSFANSIDRDQCTARREPQAPADALKALGDLLTFLHVLPIPATAAQGLMQLLQRHPVSGGDVFDLQIVATMQANGIERIYTFNRGDFEAVSGISLIES